jgi:hypothetical protein
MTTKPALLKMLKGKLHIEEEERHRNMTAQKRTNITRRIDKQIRSRKELNIIFSVNQQTSKMKKG